MDPDRPVDVSEVGRQWWLHADSRRLAGEDVVTVFEVLFWDGCRHFGYPDATMPSVMDCIDALIASPFREQRNAFVGEHCARMGSVVRIVSAGVDPVVAKELRDELVTQAPDAMRRVYEGSLEAPECFPG